MNLEELKKVCSERELATEEWRDVREDFGDILRIARAEANLSRAKLGKMCGISGQSIWHIEDGIFKPRRKTIRRIVRALNGHISESN